MTEREIFEAALEIPDHASRQEYLDSACGDDVDLRRKVNELLKSHDSAGSFLDVPAVEQIEDVTAADSAHTILGDLNGDNDDEEVEMDLSFLQPATKPGSIGTLGHYEILEVLGQGAFGIVFKAFDEKLHRHVAIKAMSVQMAATSPPRKRFLREARAAAAIRHENVVQVYSVEEQPLPYLVMEFIDGHTLQEKQRAQGPLEVNELLHLGRQIASGLAAAHAQSLIHRDVKPGNILLETGADQKIKITDFGLARTADDASLTRSGMISGTPLYMAPEQTLGQTLDQRSDLFSLGSVLYELTTGRPPFRAPSTVAVLKRVVDDVQRPIKEIIPETPGWLVQIIETLLQKNPDDRYQSAKEVADLLAACQSELQLTGAVTSIPNHGRPEQIATADASNKAKVAPVKTASDVPADVEDATKVKNPSPKSLAVIPVMILAVFVAARLLFIPLNSLIDYFVSPPVPTLPDTPVATGLYFDGKGDFVQIPVNWSDPQFTIEAFVTSEGQKRGATVFELSNEEKGDKEEKFNLYEGHGKDEEQVCYAGTVGTTGFSNASGPLTPDVREHRAITYDGVTLHFYLNGIWQGKRYVQPRDKLLWKMKQLTIGCNLKRTGFFRGTIDQLRVSKVARYTDHFDPITNVSNDDATLALYNFDEGQGDVLKDSSGHGNDGRITGASWVYPAIGLQFDGVDDSVEFDSLGWSSTQYTVEAWLTAQTDRGTFLQLGGANTGMLQMYVFPGGSGVGINRDLPYVGVDGPRQGTQRQHLAAVFDGQHLNYFVDGKVAGTKTNVSAETDPWTFNRMVLGTKLHDHDKDPGYYKGRIDQVRVSNTARYTLPFKPKERLAADESTLALYHFDKGEGEVAADLSGHGHDGRVLGATRVQQSTE